MSELIVTAMMINYWRIPDWVIEFVAQFVRLSDVKFEMTDLTISKRSSSNYLVVLSGI